MDARYRRKLFGYSSLFITLVLNFPKLLALRKDGVIARLWHFDGIELCVQSLFTLLYCLAIFYYNSDRVRILYQQKARREKVMLVAANFLIFVLFFAAGAIVQHLFFRPSLFPGSGYGFRFSTSLILVAIELRIYYLLQESREKDIENEHLRNAWLQSQLTLLKGQLNPHFLFNSLSSLSAIVREDPRLAQKYISHLSKIFRYSLQQTSTDFVPLAEELAAVRSYAELMKMRYEEGFLLTMPADASVNGQRILPMSLQLLVENALKHNIAAAATPLQIDIVLEGSALEVRNNRQLLSFPEPGTGIGLSNLNERYRILLQQDISINETATEFIVKLPLA